MGMAVAVVGVAEMAVGMAAGGATESNTGKKKGTPAGRGGRRKQDG